MWQGYIEWDDTGDDDIPTDELKLDGGIEDSVTTWSASPAAIVN